MKERSAAVTFKGNPLTLVGEELKVGMKAPDFRAVDRSLAPMGLADLGKGVKLVSVTPSLDTPVCELQTKRFNEEAAKLKGLTLVAVSMDLPFAQARFCSTYGVDNAVVLSDYREGSFGENWGVLIKELRLLARAVFVLDGDNVVRYAEVVGEASNHPDYDAALNAAKTLL